MFRVRHPSAPRRKPSTILMAVAVITILSFWRVVVVDVTTTTNMTTPQRSVVPPPLTWTTLSSHRNQNRNNKDNLQLLMDRYDMNRQHFFRHWHRHTFGPGHDDDYAYNVDRHSLTNTVYPSDAFAVARRLSQRLPSPIVDNDHHNNGQSWMTAAAAVRHEFQQLYGPTELQVRALLQLALSSGRGSLTALVERLVAHWRKDGQRRVLSIVVVASHAVFYPHPNQKSATTTTTYPQQLFRILRPVLDALEVELRIQTALVRTDWLPDPVPAWWCAHEAWLKHGTNGTTTFSNSSNNSHVDLILWDLDLEPSSMAVVVRTVVRKWNFAGSPLHWFRGLRGPDDWSQIVSANMTTMTNTTTLLVERQATAVILTMAAGQRPPGFQGWPRYPQLGQLTPPEHAWVAWLWALHLLSAIQVAAVATDQFRSIAELLGIHAPPAVSNNNNNNNNNNPRPIVMAHPPVPLSVQKQDPVACYSPTSLLSITTYSSTGSSSYDHHHANDDDNNNKDQPSIPAKDLTAIATVSPVRQAWKLHGADLRANGDDEPKAYFGIAASGPLFIRFPTPTDTDRRPRWTQYYMTVCGLPRSACQLASDVSFRLDGQEVTEKTATVASCVTLPWKPPPPPSDNSNNKAFIILQVKVTNKDRTWIHGPCSIAHVVIHTG